jgi:hypothetical protein
VTEEDEQTIAISEELTQQPNRPFCVRRELLSNQLYLTFLEECCLDFTRETTEVCGYQALIDVVMD